MEIFPYWDILNRKYCHGTVSRVFISSAVGHRTQEDPVAWEILKELAILGYRFVGERKQNPTAPIIHWRVSSGMLSPR